MSSQIVPKINQMTTFTCVGIPTVDSLKWPQKDYGIWFLEPILVLTGSALNLLSSEFVPNGHSAFGSGFETSPRNSTNTPRSKSVSFDFANNVQCYMLGPEK